jgi:heavy metal translocating P-type ATPase
MMQASSAQTGPDRRVIAAASAGGIAVYLLLRFAFAKPVAADVFLLIILTAASAPVLVSLARAAFYRRFDSDFLAGTAILTAVLAHQYVVGAVILLMVSSGAALENYATRRASSALAALAHRAPKIAHRTSRAGVEDVPLEAVRPGDELLLLPHEVCPVDGDVIEGASNMDEAYLTGEPYVIPKTRGASVYSGTINGEGALTIRATARAVDSRYAQIVRVLRQAEEDRPQMRRLADRLGAIYTPAALITAVAAWFASGQPDRFLAVLVIATPCPLLLAVPIAIIGAISLAARRSIIIKDPGLLERIDGCRTVIFDKTGTVTYGSPRLTQIDSYGGFTNGQVLAAAASLERYSKHPLAAAVLNAAQSRGVNLGTVTEISEQPGQGLRGSVDGKAVRITGRKQLGEAASKLPALTARMECVVLIDDFLAAVLYFRDEPRQESRSFINHLHPRHAIDRIVLLSGDQSAEVSYIARQVGITEIHAGASPEYKLQLVRKHMQQAPTLFVGDGINDAPAMQAATVAVALGKDNEIAAEAADAVILEPSLVKVDELIHIGKRLRRIVLESAGGGIALSLLGMAAAAFGLLPPLNGAILQEFIDLAAVLNALRAALPPHALSDF